MFEVYSKCFRRLSEICSKLLHVSGTWLCYRVFIIDFENALCIFTWFWTCFCRLCILCVYCNPANIYFFKINNRNTRKSCEICSKLTIKTPELLTLLNLNIFHTSVSVVEFEQVSVTWESLCRQRAQWLTDHSR